MMGLLLALWFLLTAWLSVDLSTAVVD